MSAAASANLDFTSVLDNFKQTYVKDLDDNRPTFTVLQDLLPPNREGVELGAKVNIPVLLTHHGGETYGTSGSTANLRTPAAMQIADATSDQFEVTEIVRIPFGLISKAAQSKAARFADKARLMVLSGDTAAKRANELALLHGSSSLGKVSALGATNGSGPWTRDVTFTPGSWSDGIWGAVDSLPFDFYSALTAGTKRNSGDVTVNAIKGWSTDPTAPRTVTFGATGASTDLSTIAVNDFVFSASGYSTTQMAGLMNIAALGVGSTFLQISTNYSMWVPKAVTVTGPITMGKLLSGLSPAVAHGADGQFTVLVNSRNFADLMKDMTSSRRLDASYTTGKLQNGAQSIEYTYKGLTLNIALHPFMKDGDTVVFPADNFFRIGSQPDPTMQLGDVPLTVMSSTSNTIEWRFWSAQVLMPNLLATTTYFSGITPNAS